MYRFITILSICIISFSNGQITAQSTDCNCKEVFDELAAKVEMNYIGLALMKDKPSYQLYLKRKQIFQSKAEEMTAVDGIKCTAFLQDFISFFEDNHLFVINSPKYSKEVLAEVEAYQKKHSIDIEEKLKQSNQSTDEIAGQWTDGQSDFLIFKENGQYYAYRIASEIDSLEIGVLKAIFQSQDDGFSGTYFTDKHVPLFKKGNIYKNGTLFTLSGGILWGKKNTPLKREADMMHSKNISLPTIIKLDDENTLFSIPSYAADPNDFIEIIKENSDLLYDTKHLIIDIRGNTGGNAIYFAFIDLYATKPLRGNQGLVLASEDTQQYFEWFAKRSKKLYGPVAKRIEENMGEIVLGPKYQKQKFKKPKSKLENVAILTDHGCMSAAESFIIHSKGLSDMITVFGQPTSGTIDYTSVYTVKLPTSKDHNILFGYPTSTLHKEIPKNGYNEKGMQPDVFIGEDVEDKIGFIIEYYKELKK